MKEPKGTLRSPEVSPPLRSACACDCSEPLPGPACANAESGPLPSEGSLRSEGGLSPSLDVRACEVARGPL